MTLNEHIESAKQKAIDEANARPSKMLLHTSYVILGARHSYLSMYIIPTQGYLTSRKPSMRVQFELDHHRVSKAVFEKAFNAAFPQAK